MASSKSSQSQSSSQKQQTVTLDNTNRDIVVADNTGTVNVTDPGAFNLAEHALEGAGNLVTDLFAYLDASQTKALAGEQAALGAVKDSVSQVSRDIAGATVANQDQVYKTLTYAVVAAVALYFLPPVLKAVK